MSAFLPPVPMKPPVPGKPPTFAAKSPLAAARPAKTFAVAPWTGSNEGEKIILYGDSGIGKTTLASMAPGAVFIGFDDGARKIRNPVTGQPVMAVQGVETFYDLRDALHGNLIPPGGTLVIDTLTAARHLGDQYTFQTVKVGGKAAGSLEDYGYGKGYRFACETMRLLLTDLDALVRRGVHILLLAQDGTHKVPNLEGTDYLRAGPAMDPPQSAPLVQTEYVQWADHVFRISRPPPAVRTEGPRATKGKASGSYTQQIYTKGDLHFVAKNRMNGALPDVVSFGEPKDNALWQFVFEGARAAE